MKQKVELKHLNYYVSRQDNNLSTIENKWKIEKKRVYKSYQNENGRIYQI